MRLKSSLWVSAYLRRATQAGAFGAVLRHGDDDAGAVYVKIVTHQGEECLYGPAPVYALEPGEGRKWQRLAAEGEEITALLGREHAIDPDIWIVEIDDRDGRSFFVEDEIYTQE
jgi:hypothetical protein